MKCANCGTELKDGTLFCPACKSEVQWVPEYHTLETNSASKTNAREKFERKKTKKGRRTAPEKTSGRNSGRKNGENIKYSGGVLLP